MIGLAQRMLEKVRLYNPNDRRMRDHFIAVGLEIAGVTERLRNRIAMDEIGYMQAVHAIRDVYGISENDARTALDIDEWHQDSGARLITLIAANDVAREELL